LIAERVDEPDALANDPLAVGFEQRQIRLV